MYIYIYVYICMYIETCMYTYVYALPAVACPDFLVHDFLLHVPEAISTVIQV